jgi:hypothetical protein
MLDTLNPIANDRLQAVFVSWLSIYKAIDVQSVRQRTIAGKQTGDRCDYPPNAVGDEERS